MTYCVYKHTNRLNGKAYVGWTSMTMLERWNVHVCDAEYKRFNRHFHDAIRKYGAGDDVWDHQILEMMSTEEGAKHAEVLWIGQLNTNVCRGGHGYNMTDGGDGSTGFKHNKETCDKIRQKAFGNTRCLGRVVSEETRIKISRSKSGVKNLKLSAKLKGRVLTDEHKENIRLGGKGKKHNLTIEGREVLRKVGQANRGKKRSLKVRQKLSISFKGERNHFFGKTHSVEQKLKWSKERKGKKYSEEKKLKIRENKEIRNWILRCLGIIQ